MDEISGYARTGRLLLGPGSDLVELQGAQGQRLTAIVFHPEYRNHNAINAALGVSQLAKLDRFLARRRALAQRYRSLLAPFAEVLEGPPGEGETHAWHLFIVRVRGAFAERRRWVFDALRAEGIGVQMHYAPLHLHTLFRERFGHTEGDFPVAEDYGRRAVSLPIFPGMTDADQDDVVEALARAGVRTGAAVRNWDSYGDAVILPAGFDSWRRDLLCDPQTSGGLLISAAPEATQEVLKMVRDAGFAGSSIVGELATGSPGVVVV